MFNRERDSDHRARCIGIISVDYVWRQVLIDAPSPVSETDLADAEPSARVMRNRLELVRTVDQVSVLLHVSIATDDVIACEIRRTVFVSARRFSHKCVAIVSQSALYGSLMPAWDYNNRVGVEKSRVNQSISQSMNVPYNIYNIHVVVRAKLR